MQITRSGGVHLPCYKEVEKAMKRRTVSLICKWSLICFVAFYVSAFWFFDSFYFGQSVDLWLRATHKYVFMFFIFLWIIVFIAWNIT
jgi:hypothetical protein